MKLILPFIFLNIILNSQPACSQAEPLQVEWKTEFTVGGTAISGLAIHDKNIYVTQTGGASVFNILNSQGSITFTSLANNTRIRSFFEYNNFLFSMGDQHLTKRGLDGSKIEEHLLPWKDGEYISSLNGAVLNNRAYAFAFGDLMKFSMTGDQIFRKEVAKSCVSQNLKVGGMFIYLYGQISDPNLGSQLMQYDTLGNQKWILPVGDVKAMLADGQGNCYVAPVEVESTLIKINTEGEILWSSPVTGQFIEGMSTRGDSIFVCGRLKLGSPQNQLCAYSIISASTGEILQQQSFIIYQPATVPEYFSHIASDGKNIYVGGKYGWPGQGEKCFLIKLSREGNTTSIKEENTSKTSFSIFPNPGGSQFSISCGQSDVSTLNVTVRNISGQVVYKKQISCNDQKTFTLDLGKQAAGNYSVEIVSGKDKTVKKIVVE